MEPPVDNHTDFMQHVWDLEKQNADLVAALEAIVSWYESTEELYFPPTLWTMVQKALAQVGE